jgi:hypothetical protein
MLMLGFGSTDGVLVAADGLTDGDLAVVGGSTDGDLGVAAVGSIDGDTLDVFACPKKFISF